MRSIFKSKLVTSISAFAMLGSTAAVAQDLPIPDRENTFVGTQKVLVIRTTAKDGNPGDLVPQAIRNAMKEGLEGVSEKMEDYSYFRTNMDVEVYPYYIEHDADGSNKQNNRPTDVLEHTPGFDLSPYNRFWFDNGRGSGGQAQTSGNAPLIWTKAQDTAIAMHELMHSYSIDHADGVSIQSNMSPLEKIRLGWMETREDSRGRYKSLSESQTVRLYEYQEVDPLPANGFRAVRIQNTDITLAMVFGVGVTNATKYSGVKIYKGRHLIDTKPGTSANVAADYRDGHLAEGESFTVDGVTVRVLDVDVTDPSNRFADVEVEFEAVQPGYTPEGDVIVEVTNLANETRVEPGDTVEFTIGTGNASLYTYLCSGYRAEGDTEWRRASRCYSSRNGPVDIVWEAPDDEGAYEIGASAFYRDFANMTRETEYFGSGKYVLVGDANAPAPEGPDDPDTVPSDDGEAFAVAGTVSASGNAARSSRMQNLGETLDSPVVVMGPVSNNNAEATAPRVHGTTSQAFDYALEEWSYLNGSHPRETAGFLAMDEGHRTLSDGTEIEAGRKSGVNTYWTRVNFAESFDVTPVVIAQVASRTDSVPVVTRVRNVNANGFDVRLQVEEALKSDGHGAETVHFVAMEPGVATHEGRTIQALTFPGVRQNASRLAFSSSFSEAPALVAAMQTSSGGDTAALRLLDLDAHAAEVFVQEEQSKDAEVSHAGEIVGLIAMEAGTLGE